MIDTVQTSFVSLNFDLSLDRSEPIASIISLISERELLLTPMETLAVWEISELLLYMNSGYINRPSSDRSPIIEIFVSFHLLYELLPFALDIALSTRRALKD